MLNIAFFVLLLAIAIYLVRRKDREHAYAMELGPPYAKGQDISDTVRSPQIPAMVKLLAEEKVEGAYIVIILIPPGGSAKDVVNLYYSFRNGAVGMEWPMIAERNIADAVAIADFVEAQGYSFIDSELGFPRVEGEGIGKLGRRIVADFYGVPADANIDAMAKGVEWDILEYE